MNIQIIGTKKCKESQKAVRFFKERGVIFHFVDLNEREISNGELTKITAKIKAEDLINEKSAYYKKNGYQYREIDSFEEILEHQELLKTPVIRNGNEVSCGYVPEIWKGWL